MSYTSFTAAVALDRLTKRREALVAERRRILESGKAELARVDEQLGAVGDALTVFADAAKQGVIEAILAALDKAGLVFTVVERS